MKNRLLLIITTFLSLSFAIFNNSLAQEVVVSNITSRLSGLTYSNPSVSYQVNIDANIGSIFANNNSADDIRYNYLYSGTNFNGVDRNINNNNHAINVIGDVRVNVESINHSDHNNSPILIAGNINLGTNENSSIKISDSGSISYSVLNFGNANQRLILGDNQSNAVTFTGRILGEGFVDVGYTSTLYLIGNFDLDATVNGIANPLSNDLGQSHSSTIIFGENSNINVNKTIGETIAIDNAYVFNNSIVNLASNVNLNISTIYMTNNGVINVGNGASINGNITLLTTIQNQNRHNESVNNIVNFNENATLNGNINLDRNLNSSITIANDRILDLGDNTITATRIVVNENAQLYISDGQLNADIELAAGAKVSFFEENFVFNGSLTGNGDVELTGDAEFRLDSQTLTVNINGSENNNGVLIINEDQTVLTNANIGANHSLRSIVLESGAQLNLANNNNSLAATNLTLNEDSILNIGSGAVNANIIAASDGVGEVNFLENKTLTNNIGSQLRKIDLIDIAESKTLSNSAQDIYANELRLNEDSILNIGSGALNANIIAASDGVGEVNFLENKTLTNNIGSQLSKIDLIDIATNKTLSNAAQDIYVNELRLNEDSILNIGSGAVNANIIAASDGVGEVNIIGGVVDAIAVRNLNGNVATQDNKISALNINSYTTFRNGSYDINADFINFGDAAAKLEVGSGILNAAINDSGADIAFVESKTLLQDISAAAIVRINENKSLSNSNKTLNAYIITLDSNAVLNIDSGNFGSYLIMANPDADNTTINFNESRTLTSYPQSGDIADIGSSGNKISNINIVGAKTINSSFVNIYADNLNLAEGAVLNSADSTIDANVNLGQNSEFNLSSATTFNSSVDGAENNQGILNVAGNRNLNFAIGENYALAQVNILAGANANFSRNIYANAVNVYGNANLNYAAQFNNLNVDGGVLNLSNFTHQVLGDVNLTNAATIISNIDSANNYGNITVGENLSISANSKIRLNLNENLILNDGDSFVIASADNLENQGIDYRNIFIGDVNTNILNDFRFDIDIANGDLILRAVNIEPDSANLDLNSGRRGLHEFIFANNLNSHNNFNIYRNAILNATNSTRANELLSQLEPQVDSAIHRVTFNDAVNSLNIISSRINEVRGVASGGEAAKKSMWVQVLNSQITQDDNGRFTGYEASSNAIEIGFDREVGQDSLFGIGFTYGNSTIDSNDNLKTTEVNSYQASLYASRGFDKFFVNGILGFVYNQYSSNRQLNLTNEKVVADYDGQTYLAKIDIGSSFRSFYNTRINPVFSITAAQNQISNYQENGAGALSLEVENDSTNLLELRGGIDLSRKFLLSRKSVIFPSLKISYGHDFIGDEQRTTSNFVGQSNQFTSSSNAMPQGSLRANFDLEMLLGDAFSLSASYGVDYRDSYEAQNFAGKIKYQF